MSSACSPSASGIANEANTPSVAHDATTIRLPVTASIYRGGCQRAAGRAQKSPAASGVSRATSRS